MINTKHIVKLVNFEQNNKTSIGALIDNYVIDLCSCNPTLPRDMKTLISNSSEEYKKIYDILNKDNSSFKINLDQIKIKPPIENPEKVIGIGLNYRDHAIETKIASIPTEPVVFSKFPNTIIGHKESIIKPEETDQVDYEVELVVVIGKQCKNVTKEDALDYVAGYTVGNDVSARDWQLKKSAGQWLLGKTFDTFAPIGPCLAINVPNPNDLKLTCSVNGVLLQSSTTKEFIFNVQEVISYISKIFTLKPGDLIFTGTPAGVGFTRSPPIFLQRGDIVVCEIEDIGKLENNVA